MFAPCCFICKILDRESKNLFFYLFKRDREKRSEKKNKGNQMVSERERERASEGLLVQVPVGERKTEISLTSLIVP